MTGFLEDKTFKFMKELWALLLSAQSSVGGIPKVFLDAKKEELRMHRVRLSHNLNTGSGSCFRNEEKFRISSKRQPRDW